MLFLLTAARFSVDFDPLWLLSSITFESCGLLLLLEIDFGVGVWVASLCDTSGARMAAATGAVRLAATAGLDWSLSN